MEFKCLKNKNITEFKITLLISIEFREYFKLDNTVELLFLPQYRRCVCRCHVRSYLVRAAGHFTMRRMKLKCVSRSYS